MGVDSSSEPEHANINTVSDITRKDRNLNMRANSNSGIIQPLQTRCWATNDTERLARQMCKINTDLKEFSHTPLPYLS